MAAEVSQTLKRWLKRALTGAGLEVRRLGSGPRRTLPEVLAHARRVGVAPRTVVDVGVAAGTPELYEAFPDAALLLVEPVAEWRAHLEALQRRAPLHVETVAAGPGTGETTLHVHPVAAWSSTLAAPGQDPSAARPRSVPVARLDDLVERHSLAGPFVVKVDVEGAELDVLAGAERVLAATELLLLEVSFFELVPGAPQLADVVCALRDLGWSAYDVYNGHLRPLDGALAQVDMAFVRTDGPYRRSHEYATAEQAQSLYRSWGH